MKHAVLAIAAMLALSAPLPVAAQTLTVLLPAITFPDPVLTPSTKGCDVAERAAVCQLQE